MELFPASRIASAFGEHIPHVIRVRPNEQMGRFNAWWIVALMQDAFAIWNCVVKKFKDYAMRSFHLSVQFNLSVVVAIACASPNPAFSSWLYVSINSLHYGNGDKALLSFAWKVDWPTLHFL